MRILVDTNVLARLAHSAHPHHPIARDAILRLSRDQHALRTVPQVLYEYWAVASRPLAANGLGFGIQQVRTQVLGWQLLFPTLRDERGILDRWLAIATKFSVLGKKVHDARLVAAMERHGLTHVLTFNGADYRRYDGVIVIDPLSIPDDHT